MARVFGSDVALDLVVVVGEVWGVGRGELQRAVGRNLKRLREATGLSQEAFAEMLGYQRAYYAHMERGERNLTLQTVEVLAEQAKVHPLALLADPRPGTVSPPPRRGRPPKRPQG